MGEPDEGVGKTQPRQISQAVLLRCGHASEPT
jgi:hypothetical protein